MANGNYHRNRPAPKPRNMRKPWSKSDVAVLRRECGKVAIGKIAKELHRTRGATAIKAFTLGISTALRV